MCKHVAAVRYGIGARLDHQPELLFTLRKVDQQDLIAKAGSGLSKKRKGPAGAKVLASDDLSEMFGIEMAPARQPPSAPQTAHSHQAIDRGARGHIVRADERDPAGDTERARGQAAREDTAADTGEAAGDIGAHAQVLGRKESPGEKAEGVRIVVSAEPAR